VQALDRISLNVNEGEFVCLVGPAVAENRPAQHHCRAGNADEGTVQTDGQRSSVRADRMVMFQEPALFPWLDVFSNVMFD